MAGLTQNYHETIDPFVAANEAAVTLATTYKAVIPAARYKLGTQFFDRIGKRLRIRAFGTITTGTTPGNIQVGILFGTGADANGVNVAQTTAVALIASQANISWQFEGYIHARSLGATGTLFATGYFEANPAVVASTAQPIMLPASAPAVSAAVDLTGTLIPSLQILRSGSTAETVTVVDYDISPLN